MIRPSGDMIANSRKPSLCAVPRMLLWLLLATGSLSAQTPQPGAAAQEAAEPAGAAEAAKIAFDLEALVAAPAIMSKTVEDDLWVIEAPDARNASRQREERSRRNSRPRGTQPRRQLSNRRTDGRIENAGREPFLLLLPVRVERPAREVTLDARTIRVRGAKFVAWKLSEATSGRRAPRAPAALTQEAQPDPSTPMLARKVVLSSDGRVTWRLERTMPHGRLKQTESGYDLKIDRKRILSVRLQGGEPPVRPAGARTRESTAQWRQQMADYNRKLAGIKAENKPQIRRLREELAKLPDTFAMEAPTRLWALFSVQKKSLEMFADGGPDARLKIGFDQLAAVRQLAGSASVRGGNDDLGRLEALVDRPDPTGARVVALAVANSSTTQQVVVDDPRYKLIRKLVESQDAEARQTVIHHLLQTPATEATAALIAAAVPHMDKFAKLEWLRLLMGQPAEAVPHQVQLAGPGRAALLGPIQGARRDPMRLPRSAARPQAATGRRRGATNPVDAGIAVAAVNRLLKDEEGPAPGAILGILLEQSATGGGRRDQQEPSGPVADGIRFDDLQGVRRDEAIARVVSDAGISPLAAHWLDSHLLGERATRGLQLRAVQILAHAYGWHDPVGSVYDGAAEAMFGASDFADRPPRVKLAAPIRIESSGHGIFRALQHGDLEIRETAWEGLDHFALPDSAGGRRANQGQAAGDDPLVTLLAVARGQQEPRRQLVAFLRRQQDEQRSTAALIHLVIEFPPAASAMAAAALIGSGRDLTGSLRGQQLPPSGLQRFVDAIYRAANEGPQRVGALIGSSSHQQRLIQWFADGVAQGRVPDAAQWAAQFDERLELLPWAAAPDHELSTGAAAALAATAGGGDAEADIIADRLARVAQDDEDSLEDAWSEVRRTIFAGHIKASEGDYRLTLLLYPAPTGTGDGRLPSPARRVPRPGMPAGPMPPGGPRGPGPPFMGGPMRMPGRPAPVEMPADAVPESRRALGVVTLSVSGETVYFGNKTVEATVGDEHFAIVIAEPEALKNLVDELGQLPLEEVDAIELLPYRGTGWRGIFALPDGRTAQLILERTEP